MHMVNVDGCNSVIIDMSMCDVCVYNTVSVLRLHCGNWCVSKMSRIFFFEVWYQIQLSMVSVSLGHPLWCQFLPFFSRYVLFWRCCFGDSDSTPICQEWVSNEKEMNAFGWKLFIIVFAFIFRLVFVFSFIHFCRRRRRLGRRCCCCWFFHSLPPVDNNKVRLLISYNERGLVIYNTVIVRLETVTII